MCVMENVNKLVITTTSREMFFYDMSTKTYSVQFLLFGEFKFKFDGDCEHQIINILLTHKSKR